MLIDWQAIVNPPPNTETPPPADTGEGAGKDKADSAIVDKAQTSVNPVQLAARQYVANDWALVPIAAGTKGPKGKGWNQRTRCITAADQCDQLQGNVGLAHAYSGTCAIDVDDLAKAGPWLAKHGVDLAALLSAPDAVGITSGRAGRTKLLYRLPEDVAPLPTKALTSDAGLEFRCATVDGLTVQDVLPPSIHPETGTAYAWWVGDDLVGHWSDPPVLPPELLVLWQSLIKPASQAERRAVVGVGLDTLRECLAGIPPDELPYESSDGASWLGVGMALHHETDGQGFELWDEWARSSPKYSTREYGQAKWESLGKRTGGAALTLRTLARWAGVDLNRPDISDFEDLSGGESPRVNRFQIQTMAEFRAARAAGLQWFVKGVLPRAGLVVLFGASTAGKTFAALDLMLTISQGLPEWRGRRVKPGRVLYVVAEGAEGFKLRTEAYARQHQIDPDSLPLRVVCDAPNLLARDEVSNVIKQVEQHGPFDLITIDTFAQTTPGANENSGEDMGKALAHCREIRARTGATVLLVHHSGKDPDKGARGWSGLKAAADAEIEVLRDGDHREMRVSKLKDGEDGASFPFKLVPIVLGLDEDGDDVTSCVVEHLEDGKKLRHRGAGPKGHHQKLVVRVLHDLMGLEGGAVLITDLLEHSVRQMVPPEHGKQDKRRRDAGRAVDALIAANVLRVDGDKVGVAE